MFPFHLILAPLTKADPFTVSVNAALPAAMDGGSMLVKEGTGLLPVMLNVRAFDVPPDAPGVKTVMETEPGA